MNRFLVSFLTFVCLLWLTNSNAQPALKGVQPVKTQMHLHALSNHNGANQPASMEYQNQYADTFKTDVIWWAEHYDLFRQKDKSFAFVGGTVQPNFNITGLNGSVSEIDTWVASYTSTNIQTQIADSSLTMKINGAVGSTIPRYFSYEPQGTSGKLTNVDKYVKSVTSLPVFEFYLTPFDLLNTKSTLSITFSLSWHINAQRTQNILICNFVDSSQTASSYLLGNDTVMVNIPVNNNVAQKISIPIYEKVHLLADSIDNVIQGYLMKLESFDGNPIGAKFDRMKIYVMDTSDSLNFNSVSALMDLYQSKYGKKNYMGIEFTGSHGNYDHITCHLPFKPKFKNIIAKGVTTDEHLDYVDFIHNQGGIATYTHPYGSTHGPFYSQSVQDYREDTMLNYLLGNNVFNCDLIEVGYKIRGHSDLDHHLGLWDRLTAHGNYLYAVGTNDLHGDPWDNFYLSWIWSSDDSPANLVQAIKKGRVYFGVAEMWDGVFDFTVGDQQMGDRVLGIYTSADVNAYMNPQLPGMKLKITQGLIDTTSLTVNYLMHDSVIDISKPFKVNLTQACFIRLSVFDSLGNPVVFGNPVVYKSAGNLPNIANNNQYYKSGLVINVKPNPVNDLAEINIKGCEPGILKAEITDVAGTFSQELFEKKISKCDESFALDVKNYKPGIYMLKVYNGGKYATARIIKN